MTAHICTEEFGVPAIKCKHYIVPQNLLEGMLLTTSLKTIVCRWTTLGQAPEVAVQAAQESGETINDVMRSTLEEWRELLQDTMPSYSGNAKK